MKLTYPDETYQHARHEQNLTLWTAHAEAYFDAVEAAIGSPQASQLRGWHVATICKLGGGLLREWWRP